MSVTLLTQVLIHVKMQQSSYFCTIYSFELCITANYFFLLLELYIVPSLDFPT